MGPPTEDGFKKQAEIVRVDEETKDLCRQLIESNKKNRQLQKEKLQLQKENLQLKAKLEEFQNSTLKMSSDRDNSDSTKNDVTQMDTIHEDDDDVTMIIDGGEIGANNNVDSINNVDNTINVDISRPGKKKKIELPTEPSTEFNDFTANAPPLSAGFSLQVPASPLPIPSDPVGTPGKKILIPFFLFSRPKVKRRKIVFSLLGSLEKKSVPFAPPIGYLHVDFTSRDEIFQPSIGKRKRTVSFEHEGEEAEREEDALPSKGKKEKTSDVDARSMSTNDCQTTMKKKSKINVTVPPKKATETLDNSTGKELTDTKKKSPQNDVNVDEAPNEQIPSRNRNVDTLFKDGKSKPRGFAKAAKYAVTDYIPLGALHSPLATPTELMATSVRESKILKEKRNEAGKSSSTLTKPLSSSFPRTVPLNVKIPPKVSEKTTFARPLMSRMRAPPTLAVKSQVDEPATDLAKASIPVETSQQNNPTADSIEKELPHVPPAQNRYSSHTAQGEKILPQQNSSEEVSLPDTSVPPPIILAPSLELEENNFQLPDFTKLPPQIVNRAPKPLADHSSSTPVHSDLKDVTISISTTKTFLEDVMNSFLQDKEEKETTVSTQTSQNKLEPLKFDINVNLIKSQLGRLWKKTTEEELKSIVDVLCNTTSDLVEIRRHLLSQCIYMVVRDERKWENVRPLGPEAPQLTVKQGKLLVLLCNLEKRDLFRGIVDDFLKFSRYNLFGVEKLFQFKLYQLANLSRFYVTLCRLKGDEVMARLFLYDVLFMKNARTHVIVSVYLDTWPHILRRPRDQGKLDPLAETVIWLVYNTGPDTSKEKMKVYEARNKLQNLCGFERHGYTGPDFIKYLISVAEGNIGEHNIREATTKGMLLVARWQSVQWTNMNIVSRLIDVVKEQSDGAKSEGTLQQDEFLAWVMESIGHVLRFYPSTERQDLVGIYEAVKSRLSNNQAMSPKVENSALRAFLWVGHHLQAQVAKFFTEWRPRNPLEPDVKAMVSSYVGTRGLVFSQNLIHGIQKRRISQAISS